MPRRPSQSSGALRSKKRTSASGNACRTSGSASTAPSKRMCRYSPPSIRRVHAEPRSSSSAHCTSSSTSVSPRLGAISAVQHTIGASGFTRSSPVTRPTRSSPDLGRQPPVRLLREHAQRRCVHAAARSRRGSAARRASCRSSSGRDARSPSRARSTRRGSRTVSSETGLRGACRVRWRCAAARSLLSCVAAARHVATVAAPPRGGSARPAQLVGRASTRSAAASASSCDVPGLSTAWMSGRMPTVEMSSPAGV